MSLTCKVPELRFQEFSGEWEEKKLEDLCIEKISYGIVQTGEDIKEGISCVRVVDLTSSSIDTSKMIKTTKKISDSYKKTILTGGDIMFALRGEIGLSKKVTPNLIGANLTRGIARIYPDKSFIDSDFLHHNITSPYACSKINQQVNGSALKEIPLSGVRQVELSIPSKPEQEKIASFLSSVDTKIEQLTKKKTLLEQYKKGVMQKIFSQEIRFKADDGSEYPEWVEKKLGEITIFLKGKGISKSDIVENGNLECIRYGELYTLYKEQILEIKSKTNLNQDDLVLSKYNDVIIPASGETNIDIATASCVLKDGVALSGDLNIIRTKENGVYLSYYLNNSKKIEIAKMAQGNSVVHLYASQLKQLKINLPSLKEQTKIANFLSSLDSKLSHVNKQLDATKQFKKALLQKMFV